MTAAATPLILDDLRFKRKLAIGEDAYAAIKLGKTLTRLWDVGGVAAAGGAAAASTIVASTFFASNGWLSFIGLGATATTPMGWVVTAAIASGAAYYGVTRLIRRYAGSRVEVIPKSLNTPLNDLAATILHNLGALCLRVARMDGAITEGERSVITAHFVEDWGFDPAYVAKALPQIETATANTPLADLIADFADFARRNPDCNFPIMREDFLGFLPAIAADDERAALAMDKIASSLREIGPVATALSRLSGKSKS